MELVEDIFFPLPRDPGWCSRHWVTPCLCLPFTTPTDLLIHSSRGPPPAPFILIKNSPSPQMRSQCLSPKPVANHRSGDYGNFTVCCLFCKMTLHRVGYCSLSFIPATPLSRSLDLEGIFGTSSALKFACILLPELWRNLARCAGQHWNKRHKPWFWQNFLRWRKTVKS